jgi:hypothetical protein
MALWERSARKTTSDQTLSVTTVAKMTQRRCIGRRLAF